MKVFNVDDRLAMVRANLALEEAANAALAKANVLFMDTYDEEEKAA